MSELLALGISHKTAPVALRERLAFSEREAGAFVRLLTATSEVREAVVISTCNRTELYLVVGDPVLAESDVLGLLARREQAVGQRSGAARAHRRLVRSPDLALDLRLAEDHRLQAGRHAVELARRVAVAR